MLALAVTSAVWQALVHDRWSEMAWLAVRIPWWTWIGLGAWRRATGPQPSLPA
ncbi:MAG TPA: hypothetical protein VM618_13550 [Acidimicrobiia bacterium]|nr:hypothetical protein [Acidimicrobiia bacterium]